MYLSVLNSKNSSHPLTPFKRIDCSQVLCLNRI